jgi:magnesium chelatase family protein
MSEHQPGTGTATTIGLNGIKGAPVQVTAHTDPHKLPRTVLTGIADSSRTEVLERVRAGFVSAGLTLPPGETQIVLDPMPWLTGTHCDLAIAAAIGAAQHMYNPGRLAGHMLFGEFGLDGTVLPVKGLLPALIAAREHGCSHVVVPAAQSAEAFEVDGLAIRTVHDVRQFLDELAGEPNDPFAAGPTFHPMPFNQVSLTAANFEVDGQPEANHAVVVAAAGGHHLLLSGGDSYDRGALATRLHALLPGLDRDQAMEVAMIRSLTGKAHHLNNLRPFEKHSYTGTAAGLVGGRQPGAASLAHHGVLWLDHLPEFSPRAIETLRVPLESGQVVAFTPSQTRIYPAKFQLVAGAQCCPCVGGGQCDCTANAKRRYSQRISGPVADRIDITQLLRDNGAGRLVPSTTDWKQIVAQARERQQHRLADIEVSVNADVPVVALRRTLPQPEGMELLEDAVRFGQLSATGVDKTLRIAWTLADLDGTPHPTREHIIEALRLRRGQPQPTGPVTTAAAPCQPAQNIQTAAHTDQAPANLIGI